MPEYSSEYGVGPTGDDAAPPHAHETPNAMHAIENAARVMDVDPLHRHRIAPRHDNIQNRPPPAARRAARRTHRCAVPALENEERRLDAVTSSPPSPPSI